VSKYAYVWGRPTVFVDPSGLVLCEGTRFVLGRVFHSDLSGAVCALEEAGGVVKTAVSPIEKAAGVAAGHPDETLALATVAACLTGVGCGPATFATLVVAGIHAQAAFSEGCYSEAVAVGLGAAAPFGAGRASVALVSRQRRLLFGSDFEDEALGGALHRLAGTLEGVAHLGPSRSRHCGK
jgi:hypothetical protein